MGEPHVISALVAKRAELAGQVLDLDRQRSSLIDQIAYIDHTLAIFAYDANPEDIKPKRKHVYRFKRRELPRLMREIEAGGVKLTYRGTALRIIEAKGWDTANGALVAKVIECVKSQKSWARRRNQSGNAARIPSIKPLYSLLNPSPT
ncbi:MULTISPECIES: hypothetical protein [unclassified Mesorhizobium]|uniref:hypothetical protein n=1 Tax=unclassified Mesorhizobium TaxID=325217 RepID=UPI001094038D|nr:MULTISPECIES: hypothetical protein [unclassified Mesorhizobium]TGS45196.1 hypothetical protein EN825_15630 [Mesorhizobium sp. M8A.F.Ca.ET.182.01.1.1]TGS80896.1 hypothetical protein EN824_15865 [Mesorhizobium sp. M8A.F.Ca.ET.181.01.1.1]